MTSCSISEISSRSLRLPRRGRYVRLTYGTSNVSSTVWTKREWTVTLLMPLVDLQKYTSRG